MKKQTKTNIPLLLAIHLVLLNLLVSCKSTVVIGKRIENNFVKQCKEQQKKDTKIYILGRANSSIQSVAENFSEFNGLQEVARKVQYRTEAALKQVINDSNINNKTSSSIYQQVVANLRVDVKDLDLIGQKIYKQSYQLKDRSFEALTCIVLPNETLLKNVQKQIKIISNNNKVPPKKK